MSRRAHLQVESRLLERSVRTPLDAVEEVALVAAARRSLLLGVHRFRLRREDLEDCYGQATLELIKRARSGAAFASREHVANTLEQRFLSRVHDRRRALAGRSPMQAALESAVSLGPLADEHHVDVVDRRAELEQLVLLRHELRRVRVLARSLSDDQRLVLASQLAQQDCADFCSRHGWSTEKYRKVAQRARARLKRLLALEEGPVPGALASRKQPQGPTYGTHPPAHRGVPSGRRQSISLTTARCCPSARKRPAVDALPTPTAGRPRERSRGGPLAILTREPREVYRVLGEEEFLACADLHDRPIGDGRCALADASPATAAVEALASAREGELRSTPERELAGRARESALIGEVHAPAPGPAAARLARACAALLVVAALCGYALLPRLGPDRSGEGRRAARRPRALRPVTRTGADDAAASNSSRRGSARRRTASAHPAAPPDGVASGAGVTRSAPAPRMAHGGSSQRAAVAEFGFER